LAAAVEWLRRKAPGRGTGVPHLIVRLKFLRVAALAPAIVDTLLLIVLGENMSSLLVVDDDGRAALGVGGGLIFRHFGGFSISSVAGRRLLLLRGRFSGGLDPPPDDDADAEEVDWFEEDAVEDAVALRCAIFLFLEQDSTTQDKNYALEVSLHFPILERSTTLVPKTLQSMAQDSEMSSERTTFPSPLAAKTWLHDTTM
jgi:hypothetical protein